MRIQPLTTWPQTLLLLWLALFSSFQSVYADELLDVDDAFKLQTPYIENNNLMIQWQIAEGYKLYKDKMSVSAKSITLETPQFSKSKMTDDPLFGKTEVFANQAIITQPYSGNAAQAEVTVKYQGCADALGVCYPPQSRTFNVDLPVSANTQQQALQALSNLNAMLTADNGQPQLLEAEDAFKFSYTVNNNQLNIEWFIAPDYHLYKDKIKVSLKEGSAQLGELKLPPAISIDDPVFGKTDVFHNVLNAQLPVSLESGSAIVSIEYQGCSASAGVCYPPTKKEMVVDASQFTNSTPVQLATADVKTDTSNLSETDQIADTLKNSNVWIVIGTFFLFGLLLSLTPCIFPMIPILSSIIVGQGDQLTTRRAFIMSLVYVLAMSVTYTVAGVLAGLFGENLQAAFQNPWIIGSFSIIFIALAFSMFGFYELQLPSKLQSKLTNLSNKQEGGTLTGVAIMGFLSALIVGPCVAPPLAGALIYIGQTGDALLGGTALFALSMGMGLPLLLLGTSAGKLLPRAGAWMDAVKAVFGVMLIGVAIWMAERIVPAEVTLVSWALLFIVSAVYMGAFSPTTDRSGWFKLFKGLGLALFLYGSLILVGLLGGSQSMLQPLKVFQGGNTVAQVSSEKLQFKTIKSLDDLNQELASGKPVMLDFYADWCVSCKEMEALTFTDQGVHKALEGVTLLKADVTANDDIDKVLMKQFGIIGPPAILFFDTAGQEQKAQRTVGFKNAEDFIQNIENAYP